MDFSNFPHPDKFYSHPMNYWPMGVELPVSVELDDYKVEVEEIGEDFKSIHENVQILDYPSCKIVMPNGATLVVIQYGYSAFDAEEKVTGDWVPYTAGNETVLNQIVDMAVEAICQAMYSD